MTDFSGVPHFPGVENAIKVPHRQDVATYYYDLAITRRPHTSTGETVDLPYIQHRELIQLGPKPEDIFDQQSVRAPEVILSDDQRDAIRRALILARMRDEEDPAHNTFISLRELSVAANGLLYVQPEREGLRLAPEPEVAAVVKAAHPLAMADFATVVPAEQYHFFMYDQADISAFVPPAYRDRANAYAIIDNQRLVAGGEVYQQAQIARLMLYEVELDLNIPPDGVEPAPAIVFER